jgi:signal transduction histidine kinase/DNA-binding response OmpR family regulator
VPAWAILAGLLALLLAGLEFGVLRPLSRLARWLEKYRAGDTSVRVPVESARGVIAPIGHGFNRMADQITELETRLGRFLETRAEFISLVSHELRTPLTAIGGYVKLLLAEDAGPVNETQREFLSIVNVNVDRLTRLVSDILDVEKMESGKIQIKREPQDLAEVLAECHSTFLELARHKGLELVLDAKPGVPARVVGDRARLVQVFMNLLSNAVKYTERGGVTLELDPREFAVVVRVRDTGQGMKPEELQKLFQKFYRTRSGLSSTQVGTGLGLFLADRLVRAHGGTITVESQFGQGTVFEVTLPAASAAAASRAGAAEVRGAVGRPVAPSAAAAEAPRGEQAAAGPPEATVWIFDPEQAAVDRMTAILESSGSTGGRRFRVRRFARVEDAPETDAHGERPELIVLDPQAGSYDLAAITRLRTRVHGTVPVLVIAASIDTAVAFAEGASAMLTKPIDDREFVIAIRELLQAKPRRVLLADRNPDLRLLLKRELEQRGLHVDDVERGNLVIGRLEAEDYDLAILDAELPDVSGVDLIRAIRKRDRLEELPVLLMTREDQRSVAAKIGASDVIDKRQGIGGIAAQVLSHLKE